MVIIPVCLTGYRGSIPLRVAKIFAEVAQLVEHLFEAQGVGGSIPSLGTSYAPLVKWMITLCYERRGGGSIPSWGTNF